MSDSAPHSTADPSGLLVARARVRALYSPLPSSVASVLVGVLVVFVFLLPSGNPDLYKAWAAYMLTTVALRGWIWHMYNEAGGDGDPARWEWAATAALFLTAAGWGALSGPLLPGEPALQTFVLMIVLVIAFTGAVYTATSLPAFIAFVAPVLGPAILRFWQQGSAGGTFGPLIAAAACVVVLLLVQRTLERFMLDRIRRQISAESLAAEQQAIFEAAPLGIMVIADGHVIKANRRMGELFRYNLEELRAHGLWQLFADPNEAARFQAQTLLSLTPHKTADGMFRMQRADGTVFWAELSGRLTEDGQRSVWTVADATMRMAPSGSAQLTPNA